MKRILLTLLLLTFLLPAFSQTSRLPAAGAAGADLYRVEEGFVDAHGVLIYYMMIGRGAPLLIVHGGPGASHDYFLPYLLPLARSNRLIFIDERGSGRSEKLEDASLYTVENMVEDVESVRQTLGLGKNQPAGTFLWWSSCPGLRLQIPAQSYPPDFGRYFLQHDRDE